MTHWAVSLIGRRYRPRGRGPHAFDCWGLCQYVWRTQFGVTDLPEVAVDATLLRAVRGRFAQGVEDGDVTEIAAPVEGCAVLMSRARLPDHVGIYLDVDGGGVLHAVEGLGVVFTERTSLRLNGLNILGYYKPRGMPWPMSTSSAT